MTRAEASDFTVLSAHITEFLITVLLATDTHCIFFEVRRQLWRPAAIKLNCKDLENDRAPSLSGFIHSILCHMSILLYSSIALNKYLENCFIR